MGKRILEDKMTVEAVINKVNEIVKEKFSILDEDDDDLQKWTAIPRLLLLDEVAQKRFMSFVEYLDSSELPIEEKTMILISIAGLMEYGNVKLYDYDDGNLYLLADFYQDRSFDLMTKSINIIKEKNLLLEVRKRTLDSEARKKILSSIEKSIFDDKIDTTDLNAVSSFVAKKLDNLRNNKY